MSKYNTRIWCLYLGLDKTLSEIPIWSKRKECPALITIKFYLRITNHQLYLEGPWTSPLKDHTLPICFNLNLDILLPLKSRKYIHTNFIYFPVFNSPTICCIRLRNHKQACGFRVQIFEIDAVLFKITQLLPFPFEFTFFFPMLHSLD